LWLAAAVLFAANLNILAAVHFHGLLPLGLRQFLQLSLVPDKAGLE
jgi:hypothetical protein